MGRKKGSMNKPKQNYTITLTDDKKLLLIADLFFELIVDEIAEKRGLPDAKQHNL